MTPDWDRALKALSAQAAVLTQACQALEVARDADRHAQSLGREVETLTQRREALRAEVLQEQERLVAVVHAGEEERARLDQALTAGREALALVEDSLAATRRRVEVVEREAKDSAAERQRELEAALTRRHRDLEEAAKRRLAALGQQEAALLQRVEQVKGTLAGLEAAEQMLRERAAEIARS